MFFEDIFPAFFQYASGEDCFESDEYIHEALFEIGRITNIQHKKSVCLEEEANKSNSGTGYDGI